MISAAIQPAQLACGRSRCPTRRSTRPSNARASAAASRRSVLLAAPLLADLNSSSTRRTGATVATAAAAASMPQHRLIDAHVHVWASAEDARSGRFPYYVSRSVVPARPRRVATHGSMLSTTPPAPQQPDQAEHQHRMAAAPACWRQKQRPRESSTTQQQRTSACTAQCVQRACQVGDRAARAVPERACCGSPHLLHSTGNRTRALWPCSWLHQQLGTLHAHCMHPDRKRTRRAGVLQHTPHGARTV
jgi:hypothetical protein